MDNVVVGRLLADDGVVERPRRATIGYFRQDVGELSGRSVLAETIAGAETMPVAYDFVPRATYCQPQIASFGYSEAQAMMAEVVKAKGKSWSKIGNFVGNGPFVLKTWNFKHMIEVERNPYYWDAANVKLNAIRFLPIDNIPAEERMFRDGQLHITEQLPLDKIDYWRNQRKESYFQHPYLAVYFYRVNTTRPQPSTGQY